MPPEPPSKLGAYPIERELGRGGMGVVYLARDPKLNREVAIKVVPDHLAGDPEHLARFRREATLLASVNHPNIASVHGVEDIETASGDRQLLVLEYVPGETLADRLARGPLPLDEALEVGRQIAAGLEAAHERGVIHRDLKPANIRITPDDQVKVLDFGLARGETVGSSTADVGNSPTLTYSPTAIGVILGTAGYMSPEQARGRPVDRRTDVWAFGCVLLECLTGRRTFDGETATDIIARILEREPDWTLLPAETPPALRALLRRCLERNPKKRQRDLGDVALALEEIADARGRGEDTVPPGAVPEANRTTRAGGLARAALLLLVGGVAGAALWAMLGYDARPTPSGGSVVRLSIDLPEGLQIVMPPDVAPFAITPDGQHVLFIARGAAADDPDALAYRVYQRALDELDVRPVPGTEHIEAFAVSPDSRWLAFAGYLSDDESVMQTMKVPLDGTTPPVRLGDWDEAWGESLIWLADGDLLAIEEESGRLYRMPNTGGSWREAGTLDTGSVTGYPQLARTLPDGQSVMMSMQSWGDDGFQFDQWVLDPDTGEATRILENAGRAVFTDSGHVVFSRGDTLMAAEFDVETMTVSSEVRAITRGLRTASSWSPGEFVLSRDGTLLLVPGERAGLDRRFETIDEAGTVTRVSNELRAYEESPSASADGTRMATTISNNAGTYEVWTADRDRPGLTRAVALTTADAAGPALSPDGERLAYSRTARDADDGVYVVHLGLTDPPQVLLKVSAPEEQVQASGWLPDGSGVILWTGDGAGRGDIVLVPILSTGQPGAPIDILATPAFERHGRVSPDGQLFAYVSDQSGRPEAYVAPWLGNGRIGPALRVSNGIVGAVDWGGDRRLFYSQYGGDVLTVDVTLGGTVTATAPRLAWNLEELGLNERRWAMTRDGRLLGTPKGESEADVRELHVVLNWFEEFRSRMAGR